MCEVVGKYLADGFTIYLSEVLERRDSNVCFAEIVWSSMKMKVEDGEIKAIDQGEESIEFSCMWLNVPWFCEAFLCTLIRSTYLHT